MPSTMHLGLTIFVFTKIILCTACDILIYTNPKGLKLLNIETDHVITLNRTSNHAFAIATATLVSGSTNQGTVVFWSDIRDSVIYSATLNATLNLQNITTVISNASKVEGLAVDSVANRIYWVDATLGQIESADFSGHDRLAVLGGLNSPRALTIDSKNRLLFWSDWDESEPLIGRFNITNGERRIIVNKTALGEGYGSVNGLTLDEERQRLYWVDSKSDTVDSIPYDGSDRRTLLRDSSIISRPFAIAKAGDFLFWSDNFKHTIHKMNVTNSTSIRTVVHDRAPIYGLALVRTDVRPRTILSFSLLNNRTAALVEPESTELYVVGQELNSSDTVAGLLNQRKEGGVDCFGDPDACREEEDRDNFLWSYLYLDPFLLMVLAICIICLLMVFGARCALSQANKKYKVVGISDSGRLSNHQRIHNQLSISSLHNETDRKTSDRQFLLNLSSQNIV